MHEYGTDDEGQVEMTFTQIIEVTGVEDENALQEHVSRWHAEQFGAAPGYLGARVLADKDATGQYLIEVDFSSEEEAARNNDREETAAWAARTRELAGSEPVHRNLRRVYSTY